MSGLRLKFIAFGGLSLTSKAIKFFTRSDRYSHIGYIHPTGKLIEAWGKDQSWKWSDIDKHTPGTPYEIWEIEAPISKYSQAVAMFSHWATNGLPYDWPGVLGFVVHSIRDSKKGKFCSEGCAYVLVDIFGWDRIRPEHVSPQGFIEIIQAAGGKRVHEGVVGDLKSVA